MIAVRKRRLRWTRYLGEALALALGFCMALVDHGAVLGLGMLMLAAVLRSERRFAELREDLGMEE